MSILEYSKNKILHWFDYFLLHELLTEVRASTKQEISKRGGWQKQEAQR